MSSRISAIIQKNDEYEEDDESKSNEDVSLSEEADELCKELYPEAEKAPDHETDPEHEKDKQDNETEKRISSHSLEVDDTTWESS